MVASGCNCCDDPCQCCLCLLSGATAVIASVEHLEWGDANNVATAFCCCVGSAGLLVYVHMCSLCWCFTSDSEIVFLYVVPVFVNMVLSSNGPCLARNTDVKID